MRSRSLLVVALILLVGAVSFFLWQQTRWEQRRQALEVERAKLEAQVAELKLRQELLRELKVLAEKGEFYLVWVPEGIELRLQDRALRRIPVRAESRVALRGHYQLREVEPKVLHWNGLDIFPLDFAQGEGSPGWCTLDVKGCLYVPEEDFRTLSQLKPGTVLLVLP